MTHIENYPIFNHITDLRNFISKEKQVDYNLLDLYNEFLEIHKILYSTEIKDEYTYTLHGGRILVKLATTSIGKIHEIECYMKYNIIGKMLSDFLTIEAFKKGEYEDVDESDHSCEINSKLKSTTVSKDITDCFVLAEDSAFSVRELNQFPGVISHRFHKIYTEYSTRMHNYDIHKNADKFYDIVLNLDTLYDEFKLSVLNTPCNTEHDSKRLKDIINALMKADSLNNIHVLLLYKEFLNHDLVELNHSYLANFKTTSSIAYNRCQIATGTGYLHGKLFVDYDFNSLDSLERFLNGYGYNPIFIPNYSSVPLSELPIESVVQWNHRSQSITRAIKNLLLEICAFKLNY